LSLVTSSTVRRSALLAMQVSGRKKGMITITVVVSIFLEPTHHMKPLTIHSMFYWLLLQAVAIPAAPAPTPIALTTRTPTPPPRTPAASMAVTDMLGQTFLPSSITGMPSLLSLSSHEVCGGSGGGRKNVGRRGMTHHHHHHHLHHHHHHHLHRYHLIPSSPLLSFFTHHLFPS